MHKPSLILSIILILSHTLYAQDRYEQLSAEVFRELISTQTGMLLDVRTLSEFKNAHIEDAGQLNYYSFSFKRKLLLLSKDQPIYVYCNTGWRSERAAKILVKNGYTKVYNLEHGIMDWNHRNYKVIVDPDAVADETNRFSKEQFKHLTQSDKLLLIDFYAPWCGPCRQMMPMIDSLSIAFKKDVDIVKINVDASKELSKYLSLNSVPYFILYKEGELIFDHHGVLSQNQLIELIQESK